MTYEVFNFKVETNYLNEARQALKNADESKIKLVEFASNEAQKREMLNDLKVKFSTRESVAIVHALKTSPNKVIDILKQARENETKQDPTRPHVGQILTSSCGYDCSLVSFYQVVKVSKCFAWIKRLNKEMTRNVDGYGQQAFYKPIKNSFMSSKVLKKRINTDKYENDFFINISSYEVAKPWDGTEQYEDSLD